jgi:hypothetical protein
MRLSFGAAFLVAGIAAGYITGLQALVRAGTVAVPDNSKWQQELVNPKDPYAIYAVGHFKAQGALPPPHDSQLFSRDIDEDGKSLRGECTYLLSGTAPAARWWAASVAPAGAMADAVSTNAADVIITGDERLNITLSHRTAAGNWLAMPDAANVKVTLALHEPYDQNIKGSASLPVLTKVNCE